MSLLIVYHTLEPRDAAQISPVWKYLSVILNLLGVFYGVACSYSFYCLMHAFGDYCILDATSRSNLSYEIMENYRRMNIETPYLTTDSFYWGNFEKCEIGVYLPILQAAFGVVWTGMFLIFGRGGASISGLIPQPWCIVMPVTLYTILMIVSSSLYFGVVYNGLKHFCETLYGLENLDESCGELFDFYAQDLDVEVEVTTSMYYLLTPSQNFYGLLCYMTLSILNYSIFLAVMITRCLCVTDFVLVRVTIESYEGSMYDFKQMDHLQAQKELELQDHPNKLVNHILTELVSESVGDSITQSKNAFDAKQLVDNFFEHFNEEEKHLEATLRARIDGTFTDESDDDEKIKKSKAD